jgi:hypothetical protein
MSFKNAYLPRKSGYEYEMSEIIYILLIYAIMSDMYLHLPEPYPNFLSVHSVIQCFCCRISDSPSQQSLIWILCGQLSCKTPPTGIRRRHGIRALCGDFCHYSTEGKYIGLVTILPGIDFGGHIRDATSDGPKLSW